MNHNDRYVSRKSCCLSPLFVSMPTSVAESIIYNSYFSQSIAEERDDVEGVIIRAMQEIEKTSEKIIAINPENGEILCEIPLCYQNLRKQWNELFTIREIVEEIDFCAM